MKNTIEINKELNPIQKLALLGFLMGNDNFNEKVINVSDELCYHVPTKRYHITVNLQETEEHQSTSGIGLYKEGKNLTIYSSGNVITIGITNEIQRFLDTAIIEEY
jgi:hypothetical protein